MASNTKNVKLGVCRIYFDGVDLGLTSGGVEVSVKTDTHKVNVDQFGKTPINEYLMGREVNAKVPLAETTVENMVAIMPGATMVTVGGTVATGTLTVATQPTTGQTVLVNGVTFTFKTAAATPYEVTIGANAAGTAANLAQVLNDSTDPAVASATYSVAGAVITVTYGSALVFGVNGQKAAEGNSFTLASGTAGAAVTVSGANLTGGADPTSKSVSVTTGIGTNLISLARELRLHPVSNATTDKSDDFVIPLAATAGGLQFAYKLEQERVYNVEFSGYPDPTTGRLFTVGQ